MGVTSKCDQLTMQSLISFLVQLSAKAWTAVVVVGLCGGAATAFYFSSADAGSHSPQANPSAAVAAGHAGRFSHVGRLDRSCGSVPLVPEAKPGLALIPVVGAMLAASSRRLWPTKASLGPGGPKAPGQTSA